MIRPIVTALAVAGAATAVAAQVQTFNDLGDYLANTMNNQLINFDTLPDGSPSPGVGDILDDYEAFGVFFPPGNFYAALAGPVSAPFGWINDTTIDGNQRIFDADILADDITAVGVWQTLFAGGGGTVLEAFDADGNSLGTVAGNDNFNDLDFFGMTTDAPIARIVVTFTNQFGWALDDLYVGQVPAPGPAALLATAGLVLAGRRRR